MNQCLLFILIITSSVSCGNRNAPHLSPIAKNYIDEVLILLQQNSVNKNTINWDDFRNDIYSHAKNAKTIADTYPTISYAITKLGDHHSYFVANEVTSDTSDLKPLPILQDEVVPKDIGYIRIGFCMGDEEQVNQYIHSVTEKITQQDHANIKGWIVDLRGNFGGNMWPMLVAIGPILGEGILGYFYYPNGTSTAWSYKDGQAFDENGTWSQSKNPYQIIAKNPYVAVLTDNETASSGEAVTIAFKGRKNTKSFGAPTFGVSTGNRSHTLSDGSRINLTESVFADRNKTKYGSSVVPDVQCPENETLIQAINWLYSQH
jgi:carboxyl-terminal processing protease